ncbi:hypothetical protein MNV49_004333 [Pseudohyphozyma bogoriensis]|nr:hypothetical protein MNV49_004333 [Pseudohyphozyma bogoriensis]
MAAVSSSYAPAQMLASRQAHSSELDEDLLSLLASDSFSLESQRDRELLLLQSLLHSALPAAGTPAHAHHPPSAQWISQAVASSSPSTGSFASTSNAASWNGWRPETAAPYNSLNNNPPAGFGPPASTPLGTPLSSAFPPGTSPETSRYFPRSDDWRSRSSSVSNATASVGGTPAAFLAGAGYRAPAVSRERESTRTRGSSTDAAGFHPPSYEQSVLAGQSATAGGPHGWLPQPPTLAHHEQAAEDDDDMMDD